MTQRNAYLPAGRTILYHCHYWRDVLERHGIVDLGAEAQAARRTTRRKGLCPSAQSSDTAISTMSSAGVYAPAPRSVADIPLAGNSTLLRTWRIECPRLIDRNNMCMFTLCNVCKYLYLLLTRIRADQNPGGIENARWG